MIMQGVKTSYSADGIHWSKAKAVNLGKSLVTRITMRSGILI